MCTVKCSEHLELLSPFVHPHEFASHESHIDASGQQLVRKFKDFEELEYLSELLTSDALSALHLKSIFSPSAATHTPQEMVDNTQPNSWFGAANLVSSLNRLLKIQTMSYLSENSGQLFVHLTPKNGEDASSTKSRKSMRGHTDGVIFPLNGQAHLDPELPPGPDLVILIGMENSNSVPTRIIPISKVVRKMKPESIRQLMKENFRISPQVSFDLDGLKRTYQAILVKSEDEGYLIRYSHSRVNPMNKGDTDAEAAILDLQDAIANSSQEIIIEKGDIVFINNRTAIHGRGEVKMGSTSARRWLIRTYGQMDYDSSYCLDPQCPFQLQRR